MYPIRISPSIIVVSPRSIKYLKKHLSLLDQFAVEIATFLSDFFDYAIVGGYVSILFGRTRGTEDIDFIIKPIGNLKDVIYKMYDAMKEMKFWCINCPDPQYALEVCIPENIRMRIAKKDAVIPNAELKLASNELDLLSLRDKIKIILNNLHEIYIGPLELNIAYKFYLGSEKDIEDAVHLFCLFKEIISMKQIREYTESLGLKVDIDEILTC